MRGRRANLDLGDIYRVVRVTTRWHLVVDAEAVGRVIGRDWPRAGGLTSVGIMRLWLFVVGAQVGAAHPVEVLHQIGRHPTDHIHIEGRLLLLLLRRVCSCWTGTP